MTFLLCIGDLGSKYLLVKVGGIDDNKESMIKTASAGRNMPEHLGVEISKFRKITPCSNFPKMIDGRVGDDEMPFWNCAPLGHPLGQEGNHIGFITFIEDGRWEVMQLEQVNADYCNPTPPNCHCKTLLGSLLQRYPEVNKIKLQFTAEPFLAGCKCYLGAAARFGFDNVQFHTFPNEKCKELKLLTTKNYAIICKEYKKNKCGVLPWEITKTGAGYYTTYIPHLAFEHNIDESNVTKS